MQLTLVIASGSSFGPGFLAEYSWMGDGPPTVTASIKFGIKTADFASTGVLSRTGENAWDKIMIYEPGNGGTSDAAWHTETVADVVTSVQTGIGSHMEISAPSARHRLRFR